MNPRNIIATSIAFSFAVVCQTASAAPPSSTEAEIRELRREVEVLRDVLAQMLEIERMRVELLTRALKTSGGSSAVARAPAAPSLDLTQRSVPSPELPRMEQPGARAEPARAQKTSARVSSGKTDGVVRGKVKVPEGAPVAYAFVENVAGRPVRDKKVEIRQFNKQFRPNWAVVRKGTTVQFPNMDDIYHNVFSLSPGNTFDLGLYRQGDGSRSFRFLDAGVVDVYCNIHPHMTASVLVVPNHLFAKVKDDGTFVLEGVPAGRRKISVWAPGAELETQWAEVDEGGEVSLNFTLAARSSAHKNKQGLPYGSYQ